MFSFLKKPYPFFGNIKRDIFSNLMIGAFVALFLMVLQPFRISEWETTHKNLKLLGFGFISFLMPTLFNLLLNAFNKAGRMDEKWTILHEIISVLSVLFLISLGNMIYGKLLCVFPLGINSFLAMFVVTCLVGAFPVTVHVMLKHNKLLKINLENSQRLNMQFKHLHDQLLAEAQQKANKTETIEPDTNETVTANQTSMQVLFAENEKDSLSFNTENLRYIESADNYSTLLLYENGTRKKQLIRSSLKRIETQLTSGFILRCHRTYIVNLAQVKSAEGNASGYKLSFYDVEDTVPVSRSYIEKVNQVLKRL